MDLTQEKWAENQHSDIEGIILDVRTPEEYSEGHIPNAKLLDIRNPQKFMDKLGDLEVSKRYYVYCRSGVRSAQACQLLKHKGISDCYNLLGGIIEWKGNIASE